MNTKIIVQTAVGGTQKNAMLKKTQAEGCHVLVGTPGRLQDILSDKFSGVEAPKLAAFVLDEADRLLDQGFLPAIEEIQSMLPDPARQPRQTMMFSATIPQEVVQLVRQMLNPGFQFVRCVSQDGVPTHEMVTQKVVHVHAFENILPAMLELCQREVQAARTDNGKPFKAIVFFNSTAEVTLAASVFRNLRSNDFRHPLHPARILEIHSKLTQAQRTTTSDNFRRASSAILFSSDVTARGMDFPNVTHVIQIGVPQNRDAYIHRIGRTARAGKEGQGWLFLSRLEVAEANYRLRDLPLQMDRSLGAASVDMTKPAQLATNTATILTDIGEAHKLVDRGDHFKVYRALLGVFQWLPSKHTLVEAMNRLSRFGWGLQSPPEIPHALARKLRLDQIDGINISNRFTSTDSLNSRPRSFGGFNPKPSGYSRGVGQRWDSQQSKPKWMNA
jgi:ATP-dependent RNA helicase MSS116